MFDIILIAATVLAVTGCIAYIAEKRADARFLRIRQACWRNMYRPVTRHYDPIANELYWAQKE